MTVMKKNNNNKTRDMIEICLSEYVTDIESCIEEALMMPVWSYCKVYSNNTLMIPVRHRIMELLIKC